MSTSTWVLDPAHSEVAFSVKHMAISKVKGKFNVINATIESESPDFENAQIHFTADAASITTGNNDRDNHLKSADFFDAEKYPELTFTSSSFKKDGDDYQLEGTLTLHGVTHPITLDVEFGGVIKDPWGNDRAGFELNGKLSRKAYGLSWSAVTEAGGLVVSDEVKISATIEFTKKA